MGRLKTEMKMLLTPEDSLKTTTSGPDHYQSQQNLFQSQQSKSQQSKSQQSKSQQPQSQQPKSQQPQSQSQQTDSQQSQSHQSPFQSIRSQHCQTQSQLSQQFQSLLVQRKPVVPSTLEEVGLVLRQVRRQKKVLEENLEALLRARTGDVLHCQLDALAANRDWTEEVRIKKTVDAWISTSTRDIQVSLVVDHRPPPMTTLHRSSVKQLINIHVQVNDVIVMRRSADVV
ncbi:protein TALPID3-like [Anarrhichthys ocellatus]|uniref:protein TALPID3-like n=1 Tax=Anarrhichthys ocellatus TaxID=433405 RepID=UPI0012EE7A9B|nr:protein TALPID3-like [Anarrhichthys ocellatus]